MKRFQKLLWHLLAINAAAIAVVILTIACAIHLLAADYFMLLMREYQIAPAAAHSVFLLSIDRYLLLASITGFVVAILLSLWLNYRLTYPLTLIQQAASRIARGAYDQCVVVQGCGEIDQLSSVFNLMAERLKHNDRLRKEFIVDVAHELRTPLTNIRGYTEGLRDGVIPADPAVFSSIHEESLRLVQLVEDLLQLARTEIARQDLFPEEVNLRLLIEQVLQTFQLRFTDRRLVVRMEVCPELKVRADRQRLTQVLTNLFENALRYSPVEGLITVQCQQNGLTHQTVITNDVEGQPELTDTLFERFHRGESSRSRESGGAGLGLAIVRQLVEAHGGKVGIAAVEGRAVVVFDLPAA